MKKEKFDHYLNDTGVNKFNNFQNSYFLYSENNLVLNLFFKHDKFKNNERIKFSCFLKDQYSGSSVLKQINNEALFLVNAHNADYAMLLRVCIHQDNKQAKLKIVEYPNIGLEGITEQEEIGFTVTY